MGTRDDQTVDGFHGVQEKKVKCGSAIFPKLPFATRFFACRAKHGTGDLLNLVDEEGEHHEGDKNHAQKLLSKPIVVFEIVALVFESVDGFIFYFPAGAPSFHDFIGVAAGDLKIGDPREIFALIILALPVFEDVDAKVLIGLVEGDIVEEPKAMEDARVLLIDHFMFDGFPFAQCLVDVIEKMLMVALLDPENEMAAICLEVPDVRSIGAEAILGDDSLEPGMVLSEFLQPSSGGIAFTVVFGLSILVADGLGRQGNDLFLVRMDNDRGQGLQVISRFAGLGAGFLQAEGREEFFRREVTGAIQGDQIAAFHEDKPFQQLTALRLSENRLESWAQQVGIDNIQSGAHLGVAGNVVHAVDGLEIVFLGFSSPIESQKRGIFEGKHGESGHQDISQLDLWVPRCGILHLTETTAQHGI